MVIRMSLLVLGKVAVNCEMLSTVLTRLFFVQRNVRSDQPIGAIAQMLTLHSWHVQVKTLKAEHL